MFNEKEFLNTITSIEQSETSELLIAKSEIIIPESKILLLDDMQIETSPNILLRQGYGAFSHNIFNVILQLVVDLITTYHKKEVVYL